MVQGLVWEYGLGNGLGNGLGIGLGNAVLSTICEDLDLHVAIFIRGESSLHAEITTFCVHLNVSDFFCACD